MNTLETEIVEKEQSVTLHDPHRIEAAEPKQQITVRPTAQELRTVEVNEALLPAYQKAATLELTDAEIEALQAPFPDELIEIRPHDGLIYIPHIHVSNRLNKVIKPGKWALICRRHWLEGNTMYGEYILVIRGCYVGESVGGHPYQSNNPKVNYSDTLESTAAEALRRIAGKRLSCGSQVWEPEYARQWCAKYAVQIGGKWSRKGINKPQPPHFDPKPVQSTTPPAKSSPQVNVARSEATPEQRTKVVKIIESEGQDAIQRALRYFIEAGAILPSECLSDVPLNWVPTTAGQMRTLGVLIADMSATDKAVRPSWVSAPTPPKTSAPLNEPSEDSFNPVDEEEPVQETLPIETEVWRSFIVPFGKSKGVKLEELPKNTLFGYWANFKVETQWKGKPVRPEKIEADQAFRDALDEAGEHYEFEEPKS